jgi:hypothetical protein
MTALWSGLGGKLAERWTAVVLTPAFAFWAGGVACWTWSDATGRSWSALGRSLGRLSSAEQLSIAVGALLVVATSGVVVQRLTLPLLRLLEGYWPAWLNPLRRAIVERRSLRIGREQQRRDELAALLDEGTASAEEAREYISLDRRLRRVPSEASRELVVRRMPTRLGDILRAAESWPADKYGLDAVRCWPALWLTLSEGTREQLAEARGQLDATASICLWGVLFAVWSFWAWWAAPLGVVVAVAAYRATLASARNFGDLVEASFDVHRFELYKTLRWPLPATPQEEHELGQLLTAYLWRGSDQPYPQFARPEP